MSVGRLIGFVLGGLAFGCFVGFLVGRVPVETTTRWRYPATAAMTAGLWAGAAVEFPRLYVAIVAGTFLGILLALALIDLRHRILPNAIVYPSSVLFAVLVVAGALTHQPLSPVHATIGAVAFGLPFLVIALASPAGMGMGDAKLAGFIGLVLGSLCLRYVGVAAALGILAGGLASAVALAAGQSRKSTIPFGPWLALGAMGATFFAPAIARMYLGRP